jgi:hypothetical protein
MNAPLNHYPKREDYEPAVRAFLPGVAEDELGLRAGLLLMRDRAMATKPIACEESWHLLDLVERTAGREAFRSMPIDELNEVRRLLIRCVSTASGFDSLYAPQLSLEGPGDRG